MPANAPQPSLVVRPILAPRDELDVTDTVIAAIAAELGVRYGGNAVLNLIEARRLLEDVLHRSAEPRHPAVSSM